MGSSMIDHACFSALNDEMTEYDAKREEVIKVSRDITKLSKQGIYSLHRGEFEDATAKLQKAQGIAERLRSIVDAEPTLRFGGSYSHSLEEWAEGMIFKTFLQEARVIAVAEMPLLNRDEYLGGILDFTGELNRYAIARATKRDVQEVQRCRDLVDALMGIFLQFDFRNGGLRKKFDTLKYTLKKLENTLYEQSLTESMGFKRQAADASDPAAAEGGGEDRDGAGDDR